MCLYLLIVLCLYLINTIHSSSICSESSITSCSKHVADLEALIVELKDKAEEDSCNLDVDTENTGHGQEGFGDDRDCFTCSVELVIDDEGKNPMKQMCSLDSALVSKKKVIGDVEKEKILNDCKNQIKVGL